MHLFALTLSACAPESAYVATPIEPEPCPRGRCLEEGTTTFRSGGEQRKVEVLLPEQTAGAPVVFVWHHLGGTPEELMGWLAVEELRADGWVVFAPRSRGLAYSEWEVEGSADSNADVGLFDDLRAAAIAQLDVDPTQVFATGFSAGGLFTSYLVMHRAEALAGAAPFSGGSPDWSYAPPAADTPVMLTWGGASDTWGGFDFDDASREFGDALTGDGHRVVACEHTLGHWLPPEAPAHLAAFLADPTATPGGCTPWETR